MTNLEKLIKDTSRFLEDRFIKILYTQSDCLTKSGENLKKEVFNNWKSFLEKNNIYIIFDQRENKISCECFLLNIINKKQHTLKNKIILKLLLNDTHFTENDGYKYSNTIYAITDKENAKKLINLSSFEN